MELIRLLRDQRQELEDEIRSKEIIEREAERHFRNLLDSKLIKIISGVRRSGKSVFSYILLKNKNFAYMNFDDERLANFNTDDIMSSFHEIYGKDLRFIFLDEIQNLEKWELFVNRLKRQGFNIVVTGSNAKLLSKELATHLTGRQITIEVFPFSFREYLKAINFNEDIQTTKGISILKHEFRKYISSSGFPEIIMEKENPKFYIRELYSKIIEKDIINRFNVAYKKTFKEISATLISNPARSITYNRLKKQFGLGSEHTVKNYLSYLEEAYLIFLISRFSYKPVEVEKSEKKVYIIDHGITNNLSIKFTDDYGPLYENIVAIELLRKKSFVSQLEFYYWKNPQHEEVDFVIKDGFKVKQLIQVCYDMDDIKTREREIRALVKASKELKCNNLLVITEDKEGEKEEEWFGIKRKVKFIPLWKWLLKM